MPSINPSILIWARETAGLSLEDAAHKIGIGETRGKSPLERLASIESGDEAVSRSLISKMAKHYRRPLITFYLKEPPRKGDRGQDFRTLPERQSGAEALVDALVRDVRARQGIVRSILQDEDEPRILKAVGSVKLSDGVEHVVQFIKSTLELDLTEFRAQASPEGGFAVLREKIEQAGVFVLLAGNLGSHHTAIEVEAFRGFAIADKIAPFIVINDLDARSAWSFTLLHEFTHILLGETGVSGSFSDTKIERFCNDVASHVLLPRFELSVFDLSAQLSTEELIDSVCDFADQRNLSRSMVAYRLLGAGLIDRSTWQQLRNVFRARWQQSRKAQREKARQREGGPNYYVVKRHKVGAALLHFVGHSLSTGDLSTTKAGKVLGVKARSVAPLLYGAALPVGQAA